MRGEPEPVAQRSGQRTRARSGADESERRDLERDRRRSGTFAHHDIDPKVLHRQIQHLFGRPGDPVDLVDEQHIALDEVGQHRREITRAFQRRTGGDPQ